MTTRNALGDTSDHFVSMAVTAGSTLSATADPPAISNATSTIAKRRTSPSPEATVGEFTNEARHGQGGGGRKARPRVDFAKA